MTGSITPRGLISQGLEQPWGPELVGFPPSKAAPEVVATAHYRVAQESLIAFDLPSSEGTKGNFCDFLERAEFCAECPENSVSIPTQVRQHRLVGLIVTGSFQR
jgi:hypothetical protein